MKAYLLIVFISFSIFSCKEKQPQAFNKDGVSFICPEDWKITDEENFDDLGYYVSIEKNGVDASGLAIFVWIKDSLDLDEHIIENQIALNEDEVYKNTNLTFEPLKHNTYNGRPSRSSHYTFNTMGIKHQGTMQAFYGANRTYYVLQQGAFEDLKENNTGFVTLETSFVEQ